MTVLVPCLATRFGISRRSVSAKRFVTDILYPELSGGSFIGKELYIYVRNQSISQRGRRRCSVVVITLDSESNNPSSTLGSASTFFAFFLF